MCAFNRRRQWTTNGVRLSERYPGGWHYGLACAFVLVRPFPVVPGVSPFFWHS